VQWSTEGCRGRGAEGALEFFRHGRTWDRRVVVAEGD
jgi:hypothetical protein